MIRSRTSSSAVRSARVVDKQIGLFAKSIEFAKQMR